MSSVNTVFIILMENHNWSSIKGSRSAPYINNTLLPIAAHAEQYYNPPGIHPSLPNYLWLEAGTNFGIADDNAPGNDHQGTLLHLVTQLQNAGISWKSYQENIAGDTCPVADNYPYAVRHNPFVYFDDVTADSQNCIAHVRPYTELASDLQNNTVAQYNFITPNVCHDMHDSCAPVKNAIKQGDDWLSTEAPNILNSTAYKNGGALLIAWDEGEGKDGPIGLILVSPFAKTNYSNDIHYTHGSTLRTVEEIFGLDPMRNAANETDLSDLFNVGPPPPTNVMAAAGDAQVSLSWTDSSNAGSYNVYRSLVRNGPYTSVANAVTALSYTDTGLTDGTTYFYVVTTVNGTAESANSNEASATPAP